MPLPSRTPPLGRLYFLAGIPLGMLADVLPIFLRTHGASLQMVGLASALNTPYSAKALLAPLVDRSGRLRRWLVVLGTALLLCYLALGAMAQRPASTALLVAMLAMTSASAVFDIALDAVFVRTLQNASAQVHGQANARRLSAFKTAMVLISSGVLVAAGQVGFAWAFWALAGLHAALLLGLPWDRLPNEPATAPNRDWLYALWRWLRRPAIAHGFVLCFLYKLSIGSFLWMEKAFWVDRGVSLHELGLVTALVGLLGTVAGANAGSRLAHRLGLWWLLLLGLLMQAMLGLVYAGLYGLPPSVGWVATGLCATGLAFGLSTAALMNLITRLCDAEHAATQFAALTGAYALARSLGGVLAGASAQRWGYMGLFATVAALALPALLALPRSAVAEVRWPLARVDSSHSL